MLHSDWTAIPVAACTKTVRVWYPTFRQYARRSGYAQLGAIQDSIKKVRHVSYWNLTFIYLCFLHLFSVRSMQRNTPGLLDRRIDPKDTVIVLLYVCIYCQFFIKTMHQLLLYILLRSIYVVSKITVHTHELLIPVSTPTKV